MNLNFHQFKTQVIIMPKSVHEEHIFINIQHQVTIIYPGFIVKSLHLSFLR